MSKDSGTILLPDEPLGGDRGDLLFERPDRAIERIALEASVFEEEREPNLLQLELRSSGQAPGWPMAAKNAVGAPAEGEGELGSSIATAARGSALSARGLVDAYFRQMGDAAGLSREEEIACELAFLLTPTDSIISMSYRADRRCDPTPNDKRCLRALRLGAHPAQLRGPWLRRYRRARAGHATLGVKYIPEPKVSRQVMENIVGSTMRRQVAMAPIKRCGRH